MSSSSPWRPGPVSRAASEELPDDLPAAFRFFEVAALGVSEARLRRWVAEGLVERVGHGVYRRVDAPVGDLDRVEVARRAPRATICLVSGLVEHDLVDDNLGVLDLALPRGAWQPRFAAAVWWRSFAVATFDLDRSLIPAGGAEPGGGGPVIGLYGPRRCIVDVFRRDAFNSATAVQVPAELVGTLSLPLETDADRLAAKAIELEICCGRAWTCR